MYQRPKEDGQTQYFPISDYSVTICQYIAQDHDTRRAVIALAELLGLEHRVTGEVVAVLVLTQEALDSLCKAVPAPVTVLAVKD